MVPYCSATRQAEADNASTWLPYDRAVLIADAIVSGSGGGIGIELGQCGETWIAGVDFDSCRSPVSGIVEPWASAVIDRLNSYAEVSPSQSGVKQFLLLDPADVAELRRIMGKEHGRQFKRANGSDHPPSIELYIRTDVEGWSVYGWSFAGGRGGGAVPRRRRRDHPS